MEISTRAYHMRVIGSNKQNRKYEASRKSKISEDNYTIIANSFISCTKIVAFCYYFTLLHVTVARFCVMP